MAVPADPPPDVVDDPSTASDAVSLHTIAEQVDAYEAQEQEDADFALALALEDEESARFARVQRIINPQGRRHNEAPAAPDSEVNVPYRDDPSDADDINQLPYRDDPNAESAGEEQATDAEAAADLPRRQHIILRILRKIVKAWLCYTICSTIFTIVVIVAVVILTYIFGNKRDASPAERKEAAWLASGSRDHSLNLPQLYPTLEESTSSRCKKTWEDIVSGLPCHRMILSPAWDNGNFTEAKAAGADPLYYKDAVCTDACKTAVRKGVSSLSSTCADRTNRFDFDNYGKGGKAYFEEHDIEEGPVDVSKTLWVRYERLCSGPPKRYLGKQPLSCAEDLWTTWGIVDGKNEANLNGVDTFFEQTSLKKTIPETRQTVVKLSPWGRNNTFTRKVRGRRVGPGFEETDCSDCLQDWISRKALSFRYGEMLEPGTRIPVGLADFASRIKNMTNRCYGTVFQADRVWEAMGWWCDGAPCRKDESIPQTVIDLLHGHDEARFPPQPSHSDLDNVPRSKKAAARTLKAAMNNMHCAAALDLTPSDLANPMVTSANVLSQLCTPRCLNAIESISALVENVRSPNTPFTSITDSIDTFHKLCRSSTPISFTTTPDMLCAPGYAALNLSSLIASPPSSPSNPPLPRASILSTFRTALAPLKEWDDKYERMRLGDTRLKLRIADSACNTCAGEMFIGQDGRWKETVNAFLNDPEVNGTEYVLVARQGWETCGRMFGLWSWTIRRQILEKVGLGDGVGGVPL